MHRLIAERLREDPSLLSVARAHLSRWRSEGTLATSYIDAWQTLIDGPMSELLSVITNESETCRALRQTTPFAGLLKPRERWALLKQRVLP